MKTNYAGEDENEGERRLEEREKKIERNVWGREKEGCEGSGG